MSASLSSRALLADSCSGAATATGVHVAGPLDDQKLDPYFRGTAGILKTYEIDYDAIAAYDTEVQFAGVVTQCLIPTFWPVLPCSLPMYAFCGACRESNPGPVSSAACGLWPGRAVS